MGKAMSAQRKPNGQFAKGNTISKLGWDALVKKRFNGNVKLAKLWIGRVGANQYAKQAQIFRAYAFQYPGDPETFMKAQAELEKRLNFTLKDVGELGF